MEGWIGLNGGYRSHCATLLYTYVRERPGTRTRDERESAGFSCLFGLFGLFG